MQSRKNYEPFEKKRTITIGESRTKQAFKDECDINKIMKRFEKTGILPEMIKVQPHYGDFSDPISYQEALNRVELAKEQFHALGARIRERFGNDPENFLRFATNPSNAEEMVRLGLATKREATAPKNPNPKDMGGGSQSENAPLPKKGAKKEVTE